MKKLLLSGSIASLLLPSLAFAAYNDVSLTTDVVLSVNGITLNVSGSGSTIESIVVNPTDFEVTIKNGSSFQVTAPGRESLSANTGEGQSVNTCNGTESVMGYSGSTGTVTVTIAPSATLCADPVEVGSSSKSDGSGGGGGGGPSLNASPVAQVVTTQGFANLTPAQKQAMIAQIKSTIVSLIQQLIVLLQQQIAAQSGSSY